MMASNASSAAASARAAFGEHLGTIPSPALRLCGHSKPVVEAEWMDGGDQIVSVSWDCSMKVWDSETGALISASLIERANENVFHSVHPCHEEGSPLVCTGSGDGMVRVWDLREALTPAISFSAHESMCGTVRFHGNDKIISGGDDRLVKRWDMRVPKQPLTSIRCTAGVNRFSISPITATLAIPSDDRKMKLCDVSGASWGNLRSHKDGGHSSMITCAQWSQDESVIFTGSIDRSHHVLAWVVDEKEREKKKRKR
eukprot:TRINITY_DN12002_c0_g1_i2.p1 TRINITY_DN12002_c0_g1~~TRINITY_DN12002_c0_g1_i2.p1  ORF type:complete len:256 (-),score=61.71 TRINITY_DN12002_c0_g1_i2:239-1006(-)